MKTWLLSVVHNCIAHPLLPFLPRRWGEKLHDATLWDEPLTVTVTSTPSADDEDEDAERFFAAARAKVQAAPLGRPIDLDHAEIFGPLGSA